MYDVIVVGGGAAGLTAAIYTCRKALKTLVVSPEYGGQTNLTSHIENYPGVITSTGWDLMSKFKEHAEHFGAETKTAKVKHIDKEGKGFVVHFEDGSKTSCKAVILAHGKLPRPLNIPGEKEFLGRGLSTCATCDAPLYKNKAVAVIGGGNAALEAVQELQKAGASKVYLVHRRSEFRADEITVGHVKKMTGVTFELNHAPVAIVGEKFVTTFVIEDVVSKKRRDLKVDGVFSEIGHIADSNMVKHLCKLNDAAEVIVDEAGNTSCAGIFAAGDITPVRYKQTVIAAGEGAKAALECHRWLTGGKATGEYSK